MINFIITLYFKIPEYSFKMLYNRLIKVRFRVFLTYIKYFMIDFRIKHYTFP